MLFRSSPKSVWYSRNHSRWILAFVWIAGLVCGCCLFVEFGLVLDAKMRSPSLGTVSIVWLFLVTFFPFFLSAVSAIFSMRALCFVICYFKALLFSFTSLGIVVLFGSAGWLFRWILLFSNSVGVCGLLFFWVRHLPVRDSVVVRLGDFLFYSALFFLLSSVDYSIILPIWADIFD